MIDQAKLERFFNHALEDLAAGYAGVMASIGHKLGLYRAMSGAGPMTSVELARRARCGERYVREWLNAQVAGGYVAYHAADDAYELPPEQAQVLADEDSPLFMLDAWGIPAALFQEEPMTIEAFRTGRGIAWGDHDRRIHCGVAAFYRNAYRVSLIPEWIPSLDGLVDRLAAGITVADVGCGHGHSTVLMARAFPNSKFFGFDTHASSIEEARRNAARADVADRVTFEVAGATDYPDQRYGLICFFDCLHDLGDPIAAASHAGKVLAPDGRIMLIEPFANDQVADNVSTVGRLFYSGSAVMCCAHAISEGGSLVLGAQAGEARLADVFRRAGLTRFHRTMATPFNLVLEARP